VPYTANEFITFENNTGGTVGRIRGQTLSELRLSDTYENTKKDLQEEIDNSVEDSSLVQSRVVLSSVDLVYAVAKDIAKGLLMTGVIASEAASLGVGSGWTAEHVEDLVDMAKETVFGMTEFILSTKERDASDNTVAHDRHALSSYITDIEGAVGVTYESGSADYAEWLIKSDSSIDFISGEIVGIHQGSIKYQTEEAEQLMVVSRMPIILGNMPQHGKESQYEKVAFMGQVPVFVLGATKKGDFILPSGGNNGLGIAVHPNDMRPQDYKNIVGIAWSEASSSTLINTVNVAVGLNTSSISNLVSEQSKEIELLKNNVSSIHNALQTLLPGYSESSLHHVVSTMQEKALPKMKVNNVIAVNSKHSAEPLHHKHKLLISLLKKNIETNNIGLQEHDNRKNLKDNPKLQELILYTILQKQFNKKI
jgi:hypothetical protein